MPQAISSRPTSALSATIDQTDTRSLQLRAPVRPYMPESLKRPSDASDLAAVALFSGIGLFVSLVAVLLGQQGVWY